MFVAVLNVVAAAAANISFLIFSEQIFPNLLFYFNF